MTDSVTVTLSVLCASLCVLLALARLVAPRKLAIQGAHIAITGGSSGIGLASARLLASRGAASLTLIARDQKKLDTAAKELRELAPSCDVRTVACDVAASDACALLDGALLETDILLSCAGVSCARKFEDLSQGDFERVMRVNFFGTVNACRSALVGMRKRKKGAIILTSSAAGHVGIYGYTAYSASKFALRGFAEALRMEAKPDGVRVCVALPPDTDTPQLAQERAEMPGVTRVLASAGGAEFSAERVARDLVDGAVRGDFFLSTGLDCWALKVGTAGMAPQPRLLPGILEVLVAPIMRIVAIATVWDFDSKVRRSLKAP